MQHHRQNLHSNCNTRETESMNKLVHTAEDRADKQTEAEIKNIKGKGQREGGKKKTEGEKEGAGEKGRQRVTAWVLSILPLCFCSHKA